MRKTMKVRRRQKKTRKKSTFIAQQYELFGHDRIVKFVEARRMPEQKNHLYSFKLCAYLIGGCNMLRNFNQRAE
jgi:ABC-type polar amino acid transport system ATPase subunit